MHAPPCTRPGYKEERARVRREGRHERPTIFLLQECLARPRHPDNRAGCASLEGRVTALCGPGRVPVPAPCPISHKAARLTANASKVRTASDDATTNTTPVKRARPLRSSRGAATRRRGLAASYPLPPLPSRRSRRSGPSHRVASSRTIQASWLCRTSSCRSCGL
jgi:hypothetical protein